MTFYATSSRGEPLPMNLLSRNLPPHDRSTHAWPEADRCGSASSVDAWPFHPPFPGLRLAAAEAPPGMEPEALADPFVTLGDRGGFSRVLLAEVRGARDAPLLVATVKLQTDEYPFLPEGVGVGLTSEDVESAWQREVELLDRCGGAGSGIPSPVEVLERAPGAPALLPPSLYCKRRRAFFAAPCPACGGPLSDVRDDRLLESLGLRVAIARSPASSAARRARRRAAPGCGRSSRRPMVARPSRTRRISSVNSGRSRASPAASCRARAASMCPAAIPRTLPERRSGC